MFEPSWDASWGLPVLLPRTSWGPLRASRGAPLGPLSGRSCDILGLPFGPLLAPPWDALGIFLDPLVGNRLFSVNVLNTYSPHVRIICG